jgi:uncharacterized protein YhdP
LQLLGSRDNRLSVNSFLKGLAIDLPAPFGKAAADTRDSRFSMTCKARSGASMQLMQTWPALPMPRPPTSWPGPWRAAAGQR